jgi:hypothetical protein
MKLNNKNIIKYNAVNVQLIDRRIFLGLSKIFFFFFDAKYIKGFRNNFSIFELLYTKSLIKKSLKIIYKHHKNKNKIFFIGFNDVNALTDYKYLFYSTSHSMLSKFWVHNLLFNRAQVLFHLKQRLVNKYKINIKFASELFNVTQTPDLIVILNNKFLGLNKEVLKTKLPLVSFLSNTQKVNRLGYKVLGNFDTLKSEVFVYLLLKSVLSLSK